MYRRFFRVPGGAWLTAEYQSEAPFQDDGSELAARVATTYGLGGVVLEVVDEEDSDPREGDLLTE